MATKREADSDLDELAHQPNTKRARNNRQQQRNNKSKQQQTEPATNTTYGQRCCFPGIDSKGAAGYHSDEDLDFEDESDAMAYLQSVR